MCFYVDIDLIVYWFAWLILSMSPQIFGVGILSRVILSVLVFGFMMLLYFWDSRLYLINRGSTDYPLLAA